MTKRCRKTKEIQKIPGKREKKYKITAKHAKHYVELPSLVCCLPFVFCHVFQVRLFFHGSQTG
jgi:hypothetical protein